MFGGLPDSFVGFFLPKDLWVNTDDASQTWQLSQLMWHFHYPIDIHIELSQPNTVNVEIR